MATFNKLFEDFIRQVREMGKATTTATRDLKLINRNEIRGRAQRAAINYLKLTEEEKTNWIKWQEKQLETADTKRTQELEKFKDIVQGTRGATFDELVGAQDDRYLWFRESLNKSKDEYEVGHKDVSIAMTRAQIILQNATLGHEKGRLSEEQAVLIRKIIKIYQKIERLDAKALEGLPKTPKGGYGGAAIFALLDTEEIIDINQHFELASTGNSVQLRYTVEYEAKWKNQAKGDLARELGKQLSRIISANGKIAVKLLKKEKFMAQLLQTKGSPTIIEEVENIVITSLRGKKHKNIKTKRKKGNRVKRKKNTAVNSFRKQVKKKKLPKIGKRKVKISLNVLNIQNLINGVLAKSVEEEMGKSSDPAIKLRYQSGRFAESVELMTLTRSQNALFGTYTYLRNPYDTFLPGHRLNPPATRDPRIYAEGGIRRAAMNILKNRFPGIALELK